jgi:hypothetical protein
MKKKLEYTLVGYALTSINLVLIGTKYNSIGLLFGLAAIVFFVKAIRIKE